MAVYQHQNKHGSDVMNAAAHIFEIPSCLALQVQQLVLEQYGARIFAVRPSAAASASESSARDSDDSSAAVVASNSSSAPVPQKDHSAGGGAAENASQRAERRIAEEQIDVNIRSEKFEEYFRLNLVLFAKVTKLIPRYQRVRLPPAPRMLTLRAMVSFGVFFCNAVTAARLCCGCGTLVA